MPDSKKTALKGNLYFLNDDSQSFTASQIQLLIAIQDCGSISAAAKEVGISYKTAWDRIDSMNNLSEKPLVVRSAGGAQGGGTVLTELAQQIIEGFQALQDRHSAFVERLGDNVHRVEDLASFMKRSALLTSARNQYRGKITSIREGSVNSEIELRISDSAVLIAHITRDSCHSMELQLGDTVIALIKSSWILLSKEVNVLTSARNKLIGEIVKINPGEVNSEVIIDLGNGKSICSILTNPSVAELELAIGDTACALFKASSVILMRDG